MSWEPLPAAAKARSGTGYLPADIRSVPPELVKKYFVEEPGGTFKVTEDLKRRVTFRRHDLLSDAYPRELDVILCRETPGDRGARL